jgi:hypothetical protein
MQVVIQAGLRNAETKRYLIPTEARTRYAIASLRIGLACMLQISWLVQLRQFPQALLQFLPAATPSLRFPTAAGLSFSQPTHLRLRQ